MRIVLPSNSSLDYFPDNSLAKYTVKLPQHLDFSDGNWEVGVMEVMFYKSWHNLQDGAKIYITKGDQQKAVNIPSGYYRTMSALCLKMNTCMQQQLPASLRDVVVYAFDDLTQITTVSMRSGTGCMVDYSPVLRSVMGGADGVLSTTFRDGGADFQVKASLTNIFDVMLYSDIATPTQVVGDIETNLLRAIPVQGKHWEMQWTPFTMIQYIPVSPSKVNTITVYLYTDWGEPIPFLSGRTSITLDFRKRSTL